MKKKIFKNREKRRQFFILLFTLLVGVVFILEIVAFPMMYGTPSSNIKTPQEIAEKFSKQWIFNESLTDQERNFLIQRGVTIASYYYKENPDFPELEEMVETIDSQKPRGQLILEKIKSNETRIEISSMRDTVVIKNLTKENIFMGLCNTLYIPPPDCTYYKE